MTGKEYVTTQISLIQMGKKVQTLDIDAFLKCLANAENAGNAERAKALAPEVREKLAAHIGLIRRLALTFREVKDVMNTVQENILTGTDASYMVGEKKD
jgi:hypothetical protein